jgi:GMP synthase-like glutamine amidotransferase
MKNYILQHVPFESPAAILDWLNNNAFEIEYIRLYENYSFPSIKEVDWLVIMGGPMSVNDEAEFPWLAEEKKFIKNCIEAGKAVIGICLGAQLIANSLGSKVYQGKNKEIGWFPLQSENQNELIPEDTTVFHWHGETFDLPQKAILLASTPACRNQIFKLGNNVVGMQCHLEMTEPAVAGMLKNCSHEIQPAPFIQTTEEIKKGTEMFSQKANQVLFSLLNSIKATTK